MCSHNAPVLSGSPYRDEISLGILQLQETNRLEILKRRWWEGGQCPREEDHRAKGGCGYNRTQQLNHTQFSLTDFLFD